MTVKLSETAEFKRLQEIVTETCQGIACDVYRKTLPGGYYHLWEKFELNDEQRMRMINDQVDEQVSNAFGVISTCMPEFCSLDDTVTRNCARSAIHEVIAECIERKLNVGPSHDYIRENLDLEEVWEDLLHMNTCDEDEYEYEGENHLFTEV